MAKGLTEKVREFIERHELCRLATVSKDGSPHVVPVNYLLHGEFIYIFTDYGTKKLSNIRRDPRVAVLIDEYRPNKAVLALGRAEVLHAGEEYREVYEKFYRKFSWVRASPWREGEAPLLKVRINRVISWGLPER